jgi:outer membrane protein assembly factor BamB
MLLMVLIGSSAWAEPINCTVTPSAGTNGAISPDTAQSVGYGSNVTFTATPDAGYTVETWSVDGVATMNVGTQFTLSNVTDDHTVSVTFEATVQGDWWMFHHNAFHTGLSPFTAPSVPLQKWSFTTGGDVFSSPAIAADGTIYIGSNDWDLYAINPADGSEKWTFTAGAGIFSSPAIGVDGTIYVGSNDDSLYAINPSDGSEKWSYTTKSSIISSPTIGADGTIYVGSDDDNVYAINPNGSLKWTFCTGGYVQCSPGLGPDGTVYIGSEDGNLYALDPSTGLKNWAFNTGSYFNSSPAVGGDGTIYVGSWNGNLYAINPDGTQKWAFLTSANIFSSPAIGADGTIYVGSADHNLYAIDPSTGLANWHFTAGADVFSSPAIGADGTIYVGSYDDMLYAINPSNGQQIWAFATGSLVEGSPAIGADGTIYVGSTDMSVYAITQGFIVTPSAGASGSVSPNTPQTVLGGSNITFTATPSPGAQVATWSLDGTAIQTGGATYTLSDITANHSVQVTFNPPMTVTPLVSGKNGTISPNTPQTVDYGGSITLTATPNTGYTVGIWGVDGILAQTGGTSFTLSNVVVKHSVVVTFNIMTFVVTPLVSGTNGAISPSIPKTVNYGGSVTFSAIPNAHYTVGIWAVDGVLAQTGGTSFTLSNVIAKHSVVVTFKLVTQTVTPLVSEQTEQSARAPLRRLLMVGV